MGQILGVRGVPPLALAILAPILLAACDTIDPGNPIGTTVKTYEITNARAESPAVQGGDAERRRREAP